MPYNAALRSFNDLKSSIIKLELKLSAISLSMLITILFARNSSSILFLNLVFIIFIVENDHSVVAVETGRVKNKTNQSINQVVNF